MGNEGVLGAFICGFLTLTLLALLSRRRGTGKEGFPPGPWAWPVVGHLHLLAYLPHQALAALSKQYGPVIGLRLGQQRAIVVSSPAAAREVLLTHDKLLAYRPPLEFLSFMLYGSQTGVIFSPLGPLWRENRKICMLQLFTAKRLHDLQSVRQHELHTLLLSIHVQSCGGTRAVNIGKCVGQMSARLMTRLLQSNATTQVGKENLQQIIKEVEQAAQPTMGDLKMHFLSMLDVVPKWHMRRLHARLDKMYTEMVMERSKSMSTPHDDLLHTLLSQQKDLTEVEIKSILHDMLGAGIHTTALTLEWAMAEVLRHPRCLHRLQSEISSQVGENQEVSEADLPKLSYLKCVVKEVLRLHPVAPLLVPRLSSEECKVQGYIIPAQTLVLVNVWAIGRDEQLWTNASEFMPERFEGKEEVDVRGQHFELLPFGAGRRSCLGLPLALRVVEGTLANLVSCFDWELPDGATHASINMDEKRGILADKAAPVIVIPKPRFSFSEIPNV